MPVKNAYQTTTEPAIASYNYTEIAEGTGIVIYYGYDHQETSTQAYSLSTASLYPNSEYTSANVGSGSDQKVLDIDFDLRFNRPHDLQGKLKAIFTLGQGHTITANQGGTCKAIVKVRKWDGTAETELYNSTSKTSATANSTELLYTLMNLEVDIADRVHFRAGETLRITIEGWAVTTGSGGTYLYLLHDPKNRTADPPQDVSVPQTTILEVHVPYVIDL